MPDYLPAPGEVLSPDDLVLPKARAVARFLGSETHPYARLIETRKVEVREIVVVVTSLENGGF